MNVNEVAMGAGFFGGIGAGVAFHKSRLWWVAPVLSVLVGGTLLEDFNSVQTQVIGNGLIGFFPGYILGLFAGKAGSGPGPARQ